MRARKKEQTQCEEEREKKTAHETNLSETNLASLHSARLGRPSHPVDPTPSSCSYPACDKVKPSSGKMIVYLQKFLLKELSVVDFIGTSSCAAVTSLCLQLWSLFWNLFERVSTGSEK